jgi:four helix bundle protein
MGLTTYRDLDVWQKAMDLVEMTYRLSESFPDAERFGLTSQIRRSAVSVPSNIAEGYGRNSRAEYLRYLAIAGGSLKELETQMIIAGRLGFITRDQTAEPWQCAQDCGKMLNRLMASLSER